jgi:hypothetical protein
VKLDEACSRPLKLTCSAFQRLLIHMISATIAMVMVLKDSTRAELADCRKADSSTVLKLGFNFRIDMNYDF